MIALAELLLAASASVAFAQPASGNAWWKQCTGGKLCDTQYGYVGEDPEYTGKEGTTFGHGYGDTKHDHY